MLFKKALLPMVILASLTGCGPAALDGTTPDTLDESIAKVASKLPDAQRVQFGEDITLIKSYYGKQNPDQLLPNLNGKTAVEITAEAGNLREEQRLQQEKLAVEEKQRAYIEELKEKKGVLEEAIKPLQESKKQSAERAEFVIEGAKLGQMQNKKTGDLVNGIELVLKNGTTEEIYAAMFNGKLAVAGADKPVLASGFDVSFENPLQPGETRTVLFVPPLVSDWRSVVVPEGAEFTLLVDELLNIANKPLFSKAEFSLDDQASLDKLLADLKAVDSELGVVAGGDTVVPADTALAPAPAETPSAHETSEPAALLPERSEDATVAGDHPEPSLPIPAPAPAVEPDDHAVTEADSAVTGLDPAPPVEGAGAETVAPALEVSEPVGEESSEAPVENTSVTPEKDSEAHDAVVPETSVPSVGDHKTPVTPLKSS